MTHPRQHIVLSATGLAVFGLVLSLLGYALATFTPEVAVTWALAIPAIATAGLTIGTIIVIVKAPHLSSPLAWSARLWRKVAIVTGLVVVIASAVAALSDVMQGVILGLVALQGPVAAHMLARYYEDLPAR